MSAEADVGRQVIGGDHSRTIGSVGAGVKVDVSKISVVRNAFDSLRTSIKGLRSEMQGLTSDSAKAQRGMQGLGGTSGGYLPTAMNSSRGVADSSRPAGKGSFLPNALSSFARGGPGAAAGGSGLGGSGFGFLPSAFSQGIAAVAAPVIQGIDSRIDNNKAYALPADRLSLVQQQMTGLSQNQVANQYRQPLAQYRLGTGGINALLTNQTRYGVNASDQASSYEALRAVTGYSMSTQDIVGIQNQLTSPQVANRLFNLTGGFNFNKAGGGQANLLQSFAGLAQRTGLNDPRILKGAFQQGSFTRANLSNMGIDSQTQDLLLQYAQESQTYKAKGGKGIYDPSQLATQKLMGIGNNFATQSEETNRLSIQRDEQMYKRQADNYASLEKSNQDLIKAMGSLEDKISGIIGARASTRPWQRIGGTVLKGLGIASLATGNIGLAAGLYAGGTALSGDPMPTVQGPSGGSGTGSPFPAAGPIAGSSDASRDATIMVPFGFQKGAKKSLNDIKSAPTFKGMSASMQDRLLRMFRTNPNVGIGEGLRSSSEQQATFLQRYQKTDQNTGVWWQGSYWQKNPGVAGAAPPGKSMHEIGLAADLVGDLNWVTANAAKFGLKTFAGQLQEPWHVQPAELPSARSDYEKAMGIASTDSGPPGGTSTTTTPTRSPIGDTGENGMGGGAGSGGNGGPLDYTGQSIQDVLANVLAQRPRGFGGSGISSRASSVVGGGSSSGTTTPAIVAPVVSTAGSLTMAQIAQVAFNGGFRGADIAKAVAIAERESHGRPSAHNNNLKTGDNSYGLWQLNMLPKALGPFLSGLGYTGNDLLDPNTAAKAAFAVYKRDGFNPWVGYRSGIGWDSTPLPAAQAAVSATGLDKQSGDPGFATPTRAPAPVSPSMGGSGQTVHITSNPRIDMPMTFTFQGVPNNMDIDKIATQIRSKIQAELEIELMRKM